jgi:hypothetical protein
VYQWWAEWKLETKQSAANEIQFGLDMVARALKINPRAGEMIGTRRIFLLFQARSVNNLSQRKAFANQSESILHQAFKTNANLSHAFTPYLQEAERLTKSN